MTAFINPPPEAAIQTLASFAGPDGRALELGIGTGRMALPLAAQGIEVHGIDASALMVGKLRQKPGGERIPVTMDDFANVGNIKGGPFDLVFCVFNALFALLTQEEQVKCFNGVSSILTPRGVFLIEAFVPDLARFSTHQPILLAGVSEDEVEMEASRHDINTQRVSSRLMQIKDGQVRVYPIEIRYAWPSELDLMAPARWNGVKRPLVGLGSPSFWSRGGYVRRSLPTAARVK